MKRTVVALLFFGLLLALWQIAAESGGWSPVLFPSPWAVVQYLWDAVLDGTLPEAIGVTLNRLLFGYAIGVLIGLPLGLLMSSSQLLEEHTGGAGPGPADLAQRLLGAAGAAVVRTNRNRHALHRRDGDALGCAARDRSWHPPDPTDLHPRRRHHGFDWLPPVAGPAARVSRTWSAAPNKAGLSPGAR